MTAIDYTKFSRLPGSSSAHTDFVPPTITGKHYDLCTIDTAASITINSTAADIQSEIADRVRKEIDRYTLEKSKEEKMPIKEFRRIGDGIYTNVPPSEKYTHPHDTYYKVDIPICGDYLYLNLSEWDGNITETLRVVTKKYGWLERHQYLAIKTYITQAHREKILEDLQRKKESKAKAILAHSRPLYIKDVKFNGPATIIFWSDDTKTVVKCQGDEEIDHEKGIAMAVAKKVFGNESNYNNEFKRWLKESKDEA